MNKVSLRETMLNLEQDKLHCAEVNYRTNLQQAKVDSSDGYDDDEVSHAFESGDLAQLLDLSVHEHEEKIARLQKIDFSAKTPVEPGAVVKFNGKHFVISVATSQFQCNGEDYMGISTEAPIYTEIEGLEAGDVFELNNMKIKIQTIN
jgi:hypothetical protein